MRVFGDIEVHRPADGEPAAQARREPLRLSGVRATVAVASARGGAGKSTIATNLAALWAMLGRKVGIVDADLNTPSIPAMLGMKAQRKTVLAEAVRLELAAGPLGLRVLASSMLADGEPPPLNFVEQEPQAPTANGFGPTVLGYAQTLLRMLSAAEFGALDLLLVDLAPGLEHLSRLVQMVEVSGVLFVTQPSELAARALGQLLAGFRGERVTLLGVIENMAGFNCDGCHSVRPLLPQGRIASLCREHSLAMLGRLPFDGRVAEACDRGLVFVREYPEAPLTHQLQEIAALIEAAVAASAARKSAQPSADAQT